MTPMFSLLESTNSLHLMVERSTTWALAGPATNSAATKSAARRRIGLSFWLPAAARISAMIENPPLRVKAHCLWYGSATDHRGVGCGARRAAWTHPLYCLPNVLSAAVINPIDGFSAQYLAS